MRVKLLHATPIELADIAISKCWDKPAKDIGHRIERMHRVGNKNKHASTLEHVNYTFDIDGISRACLQELARHRMQSLSVKSTRYTLKELKSAKLIEQIDEANTDWNWEVIEEFCVLPKQSYLVDTAIASGLFNLQLSIQDGDSNDIAKYCLPEAYRTSLVSTMNMRALQHFLQLRTSKAALWEIRELAEAMYRALPDGHKFMLREFMPEEFEEETNGQTYIKFEEE